VPLETPTIDDRRYADIVAEARNRIARYTPEWQPVWSDVNDSDPGVTLVQLFAWMSDMLLYRMGRVPELNYIKFLQLIGVELRPAQPARAEISFGVEPTLTQPYVIVPARTQVAASAENGAAPAIFETERACFAHRAPLDRVQVFDGYAYQDVTAANNNFLDGFDPLGSAAAVDSALMLGFDVPGPAASVELSLMVWVTNERGSAASSDCNLPATSAFASAQLRWEYWAGTQWRSLNLIKDETQALMRSGFVNLAMPAPGAGTLQPAQIGDVVENRFWIRAHLLRSSYERAPRLLGVQANTTSAVQAETVQDEILGGSNGSPNQGFRLSSTPVLHDSLQLEVDQGSGFERWREVDDFFAQPPDAQVFTLNRTTGEVKFGDGRNGDIPAGNPDRRNTNIVARVYRYGGGRTGNVAAHRLQELVSPVPGLDASQVTNWRAAVGGQDEESLNEAKKRAPQALKHRDRAVTSEDFEALAMQVANIRRARALPLTHPDFPGVAVPGVVTVVVVPDVPDSPDGLTPRPIPSEGTRRTVCAYMNQRRLLTTELYVIGPTYRELQVDAEVIVENNADLAEVKRATELVLKDYFHPLRGGEQGLGWPFGGDVFYSRVYQRLFSVSGTARIERLRLWLDGEEQPECKDITIPEGQLVHLAGQDIIVAYSSEN
jgi:predicted phage baseplate assembly protein